MKAVQFLCYSSEHSCFIWAKTMSLVLELDTTFSYQYPIFLLLATSKVPFTFYCFPGGGFPPRIADKVTMLTKTSNNLEILNN